MGNTKLALAIAACALACTALAQTSVYRWVDKDGKVHFTSEPPPEDATNVTQKRMGGVHVKRMQGELDRRYILKGMRPPLPELRSRWLQWKASESAESTS